MPQPETLFDGIRVLPAGHWMRRTKDGDVEIAATGTCGCTRARTGRSGEYQEEFEALFEDAVRLTLRSDVPVGAYLSGGIDSSLVVAAILRFKDKLKTFSIGFRSPIDETHEAKALADRLGTEHHEIHVLPEHFARAAEGDLAPRAADRRRADPRLLAARAGDLEAPEGRALRRGRRRELRRLLLPQDHLVGRALPEDRAARREPRRRRRRALSAIPVAALDKLFVYPAYLGNVGKAKTVDFVREYYDRDLAENYVSLKALWDRPERERLYTPALRALSSEAWMNHSRMTGGPLPRPPAPAPVRRLAAGQPAAPPGQEHDGVTRSSCAARSSTTA